MAFDERRFPDIPRRGPGPVGWIVFLIMLGFIVWAVGWEWDGGSRMVRAAGQQTTTASPAGAMPTDTGPTQQPGGVASPANQGGGNASVSEIARLADANDKADLVNQTVKLHDVRVLSVTAEMNFWVGSEASRVFVRQRHNAPLPTAVNTEVKLKPGDVVSLTGIVLAVPQGIEAQQSWGVTGADLRELNREQIYILANQVSKK